MSGYPGKRGLDLALVILAAPVWAPLLAILVLLVRLRLGAPALFRQERAGFRGRTFALVKLRTMTDLRDADGRLHPDAQRLTPFGRALRATSLDELPELLNVLRGEMSLVGPRPLFAKYLSLYSERHRRRHDVRPGLTGLAQVSGRNALSWPERFDLDLEYVEACSPWLDVRILWATIRAVIGARNVNASGAATMPEFTGYDPERRP